MENCTEHVISKYADCWENCHVFGKFSNIFPKICFYFSKDKCLQATYERYSPTAICSLPLPRDSRSSPNISECENSRIKVLDCESARLSVYDIALVRAINPVSGTWITSELEVNNKMRYNLRTAWRDKHSHKFPEMDGKKRLVTRFIFQFPHTIR